MAWPKNNRYWKNIKNIGIPMSFTPDTLTDKFVEYIEDNEKQIWLRPDFIKSGPDAGKIINIEVPNPPSITGFCCFIGITPQTFWNYRQNGHVLFEVAHTISAVIQTIQVDGATTNIFNANIVARLAGLVDKKEVDVKTDMSEEDRKDLIKSILEQAGTKQ